MTNEQCIYIYMCVYICIYSIQHCWHQEDCQDMNAIACSYIYILYVCVVPHRLSRIPDSSAMPEPGRGSGTFSVEPDLAPAPVHTGAILG